MRNEDRSSLIGDAMFVFAPEEQHVYSTRF
jgi:hypothetical protein